MLMACSNKTYVLGQNARHMKTWFAKGGTEVLKRPAQSLHPNPTKQNWERTGNLKYLNISMNFKGVFSWLNVHKSPWHVLKYSGKEE